MNMLLKIIESKTFRVITLLLSISFFISTFFIKFDESIFRTWGYVGIFVFNIFSSGILLIPKLINDVNPLAFILFSSLGMTLNESINWYIGYISNDFIKEGKWEKKLQDYLIKYELYGIFFLALIPFPFDMIGTISGRLNINFFKYLITILIARIIRFALIIYTILFLI